MDVEKQVPTTPGGCTGLLTGLGLVTAMAVLMLGETLSVIALLAHGLPDRAELRMMPLPVSVAATAVCLALLVALCRWMISSGAICHLPTRYGHLSGLAASARRRRGIPPLPPGAGELAMLPVVWILPVIICALASGDPVYNQGRGTVNLLLGLLLTVPPTIAADRAAPRVIVPATAAWLAWAALFLYERPIAAAAVAAGSGVLTWSLAVRLPRAPTPPS